MWEFGLYIVVFIFGCIVGYSLPIFNIQFNELETMNTFKEDEKGSKIEDVVLFKRSTLHVVDNVNYGLFNSYFVKDSDGFAFMVNESDFEKWKILFDGDELLEFWFKERSPGHMYRRIVDVGVMDLIEPKLEER